LLQHHAKDNFEFFAYANMHAVAENETAYVDIATSLATDASRLRAVRHNLRQRMSESPIMDYAGFARDIEAAYRGMWRAWCANTSAATA
jgi:protein O-GlcNAc transferase